MNSLLKYESINRLMARMFSKSTRNRLRIPRKCARYPEATEEFLAQRQDNNKELKIELFNELIVDKDSEKTIKEILDFYHTKRTKTSFYPSVITVEDMNHMLNKIQYSSHRERYLTYLFVREFSIWRYIKYKQNLRLAKREKEELEELNFGQIGCFDAENNIQYGCWKNTLFSHPSHYNKCLKKYSLNRLRNASLFGQKVVIDCSFDQEMEESEVSSAARQIARIYTTNRYQTRDPFDLHYCNCDENSRVMKYFRKQLTKSHSSKYFVNTHSQSYNELFPNERKIYLTPESNNVMTEFDNNAIYILGSLVDQSLPLPFTLFKARREGLEHYRFPTHLFVELAPLVKRVMTIQGAFRTLLEVKDHGNWKLALELGIQSHRLKRNENEL